MPVYRIVKLPYINIDAEAEVNCTLPPDVPNAKYTPLETYPARSEVEYECINSRYINKGANNTKLICAELASGETIWIGDKIDCQLSPEIGMFSFSVYTLLFRQVHNLQFLKSFAYASTLGQNLYHHQRILPKTVIAWRLFFLCH